MSALSKKAPKKSFQKISQKKSFQSTKKHRPTKIQNRNHSEKKKSNTENKSTVINREDSKTISKKKLYRSHIQRAKLVIAKSKRIKDVYNELFDATLVQLLNIDSDLEPSFRMGMVELIRQEWLRFDMCVYALLIQTLLIERQVKQGIFEGISLQELINSTIVLEREIESVHSDFSISKISSKK